MSARRTSRVHHANRRRRKYSLTEQRNVWPLLLLAALEALGVHTGALWLSPYFFRLMSARATEADVSKVEDEETVHVVVRDPLPEELPEADVPEELQEPAEVEELSQDPTEIDVLDMDVQELVMSPGDTDIPLPDPEPEQSLDAPAAELTPAELSLDALGSETLPEQEEILPDPTPLNTSTVVVNATPRVDIAEDAEALIETELRRQARESRGHLPGDTRSLAELMGVKNPGAKSGVARLGTDLLFGFNECSLKNSARIPMLQLAALIHKNPDTRFVIEGHTDGIGGDEYNALLSLQRASAVLDWLRANGVPTKNVYMRPCGSSRPLIDTRFPRDRQALNRRVEIHMRKPEEPLPTGCLPHTYPVDRETPTQVQLRRGIRAPHIDS